MKKLSVALLSVMLAAVMVLGLVGCEPGNDQSQGDVSQPEVDTGTYTYNSALTVFPTNWNPHIYQTATDATILDYTSQGFYAFDYNDTKDGYKVVPAMTTAEPVDVTADYVGKYGVAEGDTARVYKLTLRDDLKWNDGTPIKAADFVTSAKLLLNPVAQNYRADSLYSGSLAIVNAKNYLYQGQSVKVENSPDGEAFTYNVADLVEGTDGFLKTADGAAVYIGLDAPYAWMSGDSLTAYYDAKYISDDIYNTLKETADEEGYVPATKALLDKLFEFTNSDTWGNETYDQLGYYLSYDKTYADMEWDNNVGMFTTAENELVLVLEKPLKGFYLLYALSDSWLVNETLYKSCEKIENDVYTNTYGTTTETTMSYGPYKLVDFQSDKIIVLDRNPEWYGYNDDANKGLYKTTDIRIEFVPEASTRLEMFLSGKLDAYGLSSDDMETYSTSDYTYYTTGDSTFFIALNPDFDALKSAETDGLNKTILTVPEFRMAISFALDRSAFCLATSPTNNAAFGVFSSFIIADPESGTAYRTTPEAKKVIADFWNLTDDIGEGKLYADIDAAIESVTGYNLTKAQTLFDTAYDKAIEAGLMDADDKVSILVGTPNNTSNFYNKGYEFIVNNYTEAVKGTKLEGKLVFTRDDTLGNAFSKALKNNDVDLLFGVGWTGSALDPYNLMEAYTSSSYQYDPSWDTTTSLLEIDLSGVKYTASVWDWTRAIMGEDITIKAADDSTKTYAAGSAEGDPAERLAILAALEGAVLDTYDMIPIMDDSSAALKGMKINYYTEEYIYGVGRGGIKYMTYNYNDEEWTAFVASQEGGILNYK